jgi:hypothetical protein
MFWALQNGRLRKERRKTTLEPTKVYAVVKIAMQYRVVAKLLALEVGFKWEDHGLL